MTDFKIGFEEIAQGVRINDSLTDMTAEAENPIAAVADGLGVDASALTDVAMARSLMLGEGTAIPQLLMDSLPGIPAAVEAEIMRLSAMSAAWLDGFFTALHIIEQKLAAGDLTCAE